jgi:hypothetical protein
LIVQSIDPLPVVNCFACQGHPASIELRINPRTLLLLCPGCWAALAWLATYWQQSGQMRAKVDEDGRVIGTRRLVEADG